MVAMRYYAGFKNGRMFHDTVDMGEDGEFQCPALYVNEADAVRERDVYKKFTKIKLVEVTIV